MRCRDQPYTLHIGSSDILNLCMQYMSSKNLRNFIIKFFFLKGVHLFCAWIMVCSMVLNDMRCRDQPYTLHIGSSDILNLCMQYMSSKNLRNFIIKIFFLKGVHLFCAWIMVCSMVCSMVLNDMRCRDQPYTLHIGSSDMLNLCMQYMSSKNLRNFIIKFFFLKGVHLFCAWIMVCSMVLNDMRCRDQPYTLHIGSSDMLNLCMQYMSSKNLRNFIINFFF